MTQNLSITDIPGILVGHAQDEDAITGCTVILYEKGAVAGVDQRGGAPGTRETDALHPLHLVTRAHAIVLAGGSAYGLDAATGVMRYLEEKGVGFNVGVAKVPIVPAAILFDLGIGKSNVRPDAEMGYQACLNASSSPPAEGNVGAGIGATVGKVFGVNQAMKSGIGTATIDVGGGIIVSAIMAVNAFGDIIDPETNQIIAGARSKKIGPISLGSEPLFANTMKVLRTNIGRTILGFATRGGNTIIGVVVTNAKLTKEGATKVAQMAQNGIAKTVRPAHTMVDGDTIFTLATGQKNADVSIVGAFAAEAVSKAIIKAVLAAEPLGGLPSAKSIHV